MHNPSPKKGYTPETFVLLDKFDALIIITWNIDSIF